MTTNKTVVNRAITFGRTLCQAKEKVGHGKWEKWLNDNCRDISVRTAQRYMKLDCPEVRSELGKNDTRVVFRLRTALALANRKPEPPTEQHAPEEMKGPFSNCAGYKKAAPIAEGGRLELQAFSA